MKRKSALHALTGAALVAVATLLPASSAAAYPTQRGIPPLPVGQLATFAGIGDQIWAQNPQSGWCKWLNVGCLQDTDTPPDPDEYAGNYGQIGVVCQNGSFVKINYKRSPYAPDTTGWATSNSVILGGWSHPPTAITNDNVRTCAASET